MKTYSFRLFPTKNEKEKLLEISKIRNEIYNFYLNKNIQEYQKNKKIIHKFEMNKQFTQDKKIRYEWQKVNAKMIQSTLAHLYGNYKSFFTKFKKDKTTKLPKFINNINEFRTLVFNQNGWSFKKNNIILINQIPIKYTSNIKNFKDLNIKESRIKFVNNKWLCDITIEEKVEKLIDLTIKNKVLALDLGLKKLATGIDNSGKVLVLENKAKKMNKYFNKKIDNIKSKISKKKKDSRKHKKLNETKKKLYSKKNSQIKQALHIESKKLVNMNYNFIIVGDLRVKELMMKKKNKFSKISKSFSNSNISMFLDFVTYKARNKGQNFIKIDEKYTTQLNCFTNEFFKEKIELKDRTVQLNENIIIDRDLNSAINIFNRWYDQNKNNFAVMTPPLPLGSVLEENNLFKKILNDKI